MLDTNDLVRPEPPTIKIAKSPPKQKAHMATNHSIHYNPKAGWQQFGVLPFSYDPPRRRKINFTLEQT
jgi:hypothetical protein